MRKLLLLLTLLLSISTYVAAQNYTEVVYLKNGSIIKGVIIEQVPNVSLKIKTSDGSLIICQMSDVEKITKEERYTRDYRKEANNRKAARNTLKGYKGFVDFAYIGDVSDYNAVLTTTGIPTIRKMSEWRKPHTRFLSSLSF